MKQPDSNPNLPGQGRRASSMQEDLRILSAVLGSSRTGLMNVFRAKQEDHPRTSSKLHLQSLSTSVCVCVCHLGVRCLPGAGEVTFPRFEMSVGQQLAQF